MTRRILGCDHYCFKEDFLRLKEELEASRHMADFSDVSHIEIEIMEMETLRNRNASDSISDLGVHAGAICLDFATRFMPKDLNGDEITLEAIRCQLGRCRFENPHDRTTAAHAEFTVGFLGCNVTVTLRVGKYLPENKKLLKVFLNSIDEPWTADLSKGPDKKEPGSPHDLVFEMAKNNGDEFYQLTLQAISSSVLAFELFDIGKQSEIVEYEMGEDIFGVSGKLRSFVKHQHD